MCGFSEVRRSSKSLFLLLFLALMYTIYTLQSYPLALRDNMLCVTYITEFPLSLPDCRLIWMPPTPPLCPDD